ncbi:MAG: aspartate--tRNA ligase, partial [Bacteroidales bacterium]|nr:aspartate--tRNA ligase [Bacteroidales bacterium]
SIRIFNKDLQRKMFSVLRFYRRTGRIPVRISDECIPLWSSPHGGIAFGFDRLVSIFAALDSIRDVIAFPKNNAGRDMMIDTPSLISMNN